MLNFEKIKKVYFVGIGGIIMSALAGYFLAQGKEVSGSDRESSEITEKLEKQGVKLNIGHKVTNISKDIDLVVYSKAIDEDNIELKGAKKLNLSVYSVYQILGELSKGKFSIAVAGIHGKSTTSSIIGLIAETAGLDPTVFIGTQLKELDGNFRAGKSDYLISEACEYKDNFLEYHPNIAIIMNVEAEHLDYFKNLTGVKKSFRKFISQIKKDGWLVVNKDNEKLMDLIKFFKGEERKIITFGVEKDADFQAQNIEIGENGCAQFELLCRRREFVDYNGVRFSMMVPGRFNVYNALAAICAAAILEVKVQVTQEVLEKFKGIWRRFEFKGEIEGVEYYDDYAHHPTEIRATLKAAEEKFKGKNFWLVYQPHLYSRTKDFMPKLAESLNLAENLILAPIYAAREENKWGIESSDLAELINKKYERKNSAIYLDNFEKIKKYLDKNVKLGDVVMTMGAGDINKALKHKSIKA